MILIVKNPRQYFFCLLNLWSWIPHRADQLWALGNLDGGEKNNSENMGDRGNRWQKSIIEKKTNSIRIMFLMGIGPHGSSLVLLFWRLCLTHIVQICYLLHPVDHRVLSLVGEAQPAILGSAPTEIVKSPLCSQPEYIPRSVMPDSGEKIFLSQIARKSVMNQWGFRNLQLSKLELDSPK